MRARTRLAAVFGLMVFCVHLCAALGADSGASNLQPSTIGLSFLDIDLGSSELGLTPSADTGLSALADAALSSSAMTMQSRVGPTGPLAPPGAVFGTNAPPQSVSGAQSGQLRNYGRQMGQDWLKDTLGIDLTGMRIVWDPKTWTFVTKSSAGADRSAGGDVAQGVSSGAASSAQGKGISVQLVQTGGLNRLSQGVVPYGVQIQGVFKPVQSLKGISASLNIPLSPFDEWSADASMPMAWGVAEAPWWWRELGLGQSLSLHSGINSRLGFNQVETGMRTQWTPGFWGPWDLDYAWDLRYGEGSAGASSNWLKFSKEF